MKTIQDARKIYVFEKWHPREKVAPGIPETHFIFNATRPLVSPDTWQGKWISGVFYAAIDPTDEFAAGFIDRTVSLDGGLMIWVGEDELNDYGQSLADEYNMKLTELLNDFDERDLWGSFVSDVVINNRITKGETDGR